MCKYTKSALDLASTMLKYTYRQRKVDMNDKLKSKISLVVILAIVIFVIDYNRVSCCQVAYGCYKCKNYIEYYFGWIIIH